MKNYRFISFLLVWVVGFLSAPSYPLTVYVDDLGGNDLNSGFSWDQAKKTIQAGVDAAHSIGSETRVWVKKGAYRESVIMQSSVSLYGGFAGIETRLSERNRARNQTVIDAGKIKNRSPAFHAVVMENISSALIDGFVITGGRAFGSGEHANGGGIFCKELDEKCLVANCTIVGNRAEKYGGGVYWAPDSPPGFVNCTISWNTAHWGGGVFCGGGARSSFQSSLIKNNNAIGNSSRGGGVYCIDNTLFRDTEISANRAELGGGVCCFKTASFDNCLLLQNVAGFGGALYHGESALLNHCTLTANSAYKGGGIFSQKLPVTISNSILWYNSGGAVHHAENPPDIRYSCIEGGYKGEGNISENPGFTGWNGKTDIYINIKNRGIANGTRQHPFQDIARAISCYSLQLSEDSPCRQAGEGGANIGAHHPPGEKSLTKGATFHIAPGKYDITHVCFDWLVSVRGAGPDKTTLQGSFRGLHTGCFLKDVTIKGVNLTGLVVPKGESPVIENCRIVDHTVQDFGGGVYLSEGSDPLFTNCRILTNRSERSGGGIFCSENSAGLFQNCLIEGNASGKNGGGIYIGPGSTAEFRDCSIIKSGSWHDGAGVFCDTGCKPSFLSCLFSDNSSYFGGAIYCNKGAFPQFRNCRILTNFASFGGGIYSSSSVGEFTDCLLENNTAWYGGGAYFIHNPSPVFTNTRFRFNNAKKGAGIYCHESDPHISGCRIVANSSSEQGGGIYCFKAKPAIIHCDMLSNISPEGGALALFQSDPAIKNSIVWDNDGEAIAAHDSSPDISYSCVQDGWKGKGNISDEPCFVGWGEWKDVYIDAGTTVPLSGTKEHPFLSINQALSLFSESLAQNSPCLKTGEKGKNMGADYEPGNKSGNSNVIFHLAPGEYDLADCYFFRHVSLEGEAPEKTVLKGTVRGLRTGSRMKNLTVKGGKRSGVRINPLQAPLLEHCIIKQNQARSMYFNGGGVFCDTCSKPEFSDCTISENRAIEPYSLGGGVFCSEGSEPFFRECRINQNNSKSKGGGVYCDENASPVFADCQLNANQTGDAFPGGGALFCYGSNPVFTSCTLSANITPGEGGGIACDFESSPRFSNCIITFNSSGKNGGGIHCLRQSAPYFSNCVIYKNAAQKNGGAFYNLRSSPRILNSIVWGNYPNGLSDHYSSPQVLYSTVQGGYGGVGNLDTDPLFISPGSLGAKPGSTRRGQGNYLLRYDSPLIDAGHPDPRYNDACRPPAKGTTRNDIGAFGGSLNCEEAWSSLETMGEAKP